MVMSWEKRVAITALAIGLLVSLVYIAYNAQQRSEDNHERLYRAGSTFVVYVYHANAYFSLAVSATPQDHVEHIRRAGAHILAARAAGSWLVDEALRQGIAAMGIDYFSGVNGEELVLYRGLGVDPELDRRLSIIAKNVRILHDSLSRELFRSGDKRRIESVIGGIVLLPPR